MKQDNFLFKNERQFSNYIKKYLSNNGFKMIQRIESGSTARGIPDLYIADIDQWVELKCQNNLSLHDDMWTIDWRAGQQAWAANYYRIKEEMFKKYGNRRNSGRYVMTLVAMKDCITIIQMKKVYKDNVVTKITNTLRIASFDKEGYEIRANKCDPKGYKLVNYNGYVQLIDYFLYWKGL